MTDNTGNTGNTGMTDNSGMTRNTGMVDDTGVRTLRRSSSARMITGVCGGIAEYARIDPNLVRLAFAVLCFFGGAGLVLYVLAWLLMPAAEESTSIASRLVSQYWRPVS